MANNTITISTNNIMDLVLIQGELVSNNNLVGELVSNYNLVGHFMPFIIFFSRWPSTEFIVKY